MDFVRPHFQACCGCVLMLLALAVRPPAVAAGRCPGYTSYGLSVPDQLVHYEQYVTYAKLNEERLRFWVHRHDELLREQTQYATSHLEPSPAIQKGLDHARDEIGAKRHDLQFYTSLRDQYERTAKEDTERLIRGGCFEVTEIRAYTPNIQVLWRASSAT
jgi:hypothetical protein